MFGEAFAESGPQCIVITGVPTLIDNVDSWLRHEQPAEAVSTREQTISWLAARIP